MAGVASSFLPQATKAVAAKTAAKTRDLFILKSSCGLSKQFLEVVKAVHRPDSDKKQI